MSERVYSHDEMYAALCLWEEVVNPVSPDAPQPWQGLRDAWGTGALRDEIIKLAHACDEAWTRAQKRFEVVLEEYHVEVRRVEQVGGEPPAYPDDPGSFDWEFVPVWLRLCVDWSGEKPRVREVDTTVSKAA